MLKAIAMIVVGAALLALPEPIVSTTIGITFISRGLRKLREDGEVSNVDEDDQHFTLYPFTTYII